MGRPTTWSQTVAVSGAGDRPYSLFCEPEGAELEIRPGDRVLITFSGPKPHELELSWFGDGLVLCRNGASDVVIEDRAGRPLRW